jgi:hypothetical protein
MDPVAGLSYVRGAGVGDEGVLTVGKESFFSLVTESGMGSARCVDLGRIQIVISGPQNQSVGSRFVAPCNNGEYQIAWTPCLGGWHDVTVFVDGTRVQNVPVTIWVSGSLGVEYKFEESAPHIVTDFDGLLRR